MLPLIIFHLFGGQDLASENKDLKSEIEAAFTLVEKLMAENAELVEKVICQVLCGYYFY